ncbi:MAG: sulfurtransferase TusA family protein, partial [Clostridia bacterium]|nr:sulfurtransferase TusA family protein [Clostridia bacterium]
ILDGLRPGQVLRVVVDYPPAVESIPRTIRLHGHRALGVELLGEGIWAVYLEKAG